MVFFVFFDTILFSDTSKQTNAKLSNFMQSDS